jgi:hypothetical protein
MKKRTRFTLTPGMRTRPSLADNTIPRTPEDRSAQVAEWLDLMEDAGIRTGTVLADVHAALDNEDALMQRARAARQLAADEARAAARRLAGDPTTAPRPAVAVEDYSTALGLAMASVWRAFTTADLAAIIGPGHDAAVRAITAAAEQIPPAVGDIEAAARAGVSAEWIKLERAIVGYEVVVWLWCNLHARHAIAPGAGVKTGRHRDYSTTEVLYADPPAASRAAEAANLAGLAHEWRVVHTVTAGRPTLARLTASGRAPVDLRTAAVFDLADELQARHRPGTRNGPRPPQEQVDKANPGRRRRQDSGTAA